MCPCFVVVFRDDDCFGEDDKLFWITLPLLKPLKKEQKVYIPLCWTILYLYKRIAVSFTICELILVFVKRIVFVIIIDVNVIDVNANKVLYKSCYSDLIRVASE